MRPSDEEILKQEEAIRKEINSQTPLVGPLEPIELLQDDYKDGNQTFYSKLLQLQDYAIRRVRGDGNCFFRAMAFELIKQTKLSMKNDLITKIKNYFVQVGFDKMATEDFIEDFESQLNQEKAHVDEVWQKDEGYSHAVVVVLRLLTSAFLRIHSQDYEPFLCEYTDMATYCQRQVECIGVESEQIHITVLSKALDAQIIVYYVDAGSGDRIEEIEFNPEGEALYRVPLLYRPGHYDLLYSPGSF